MQDTDEWHKFSLALAHEVYLILERKKKGW